MINLLPDLEKKEINAARHNILLIRYIAMTLLATAALYMVMQSSEQILSSTKQSADELIATSDTKAGVYADTKAKVGELDSKLSTAQSVLDQEVRYSKLLTGIAAQMPEGTVINDFNLSSESLKSPVTLTAYAKTTDASLALQSAFRSSALFSSVEFQTVGESDGRVSGYPVSVTMTVVFNEAELR